MKNGLIIDGTGAPGHMSDILIKDDIIQKIDKNLKTNGFEVIDASGKIISPGFIDIHNHCDLNLFVSTKIEPYIMQGVTTIAVGMCGLGVAPSNEKMKNNYFEFINKAFSSSQMMYASLKDYFNAIEKKKISANLAFFIPQGNVRACVLGAEERPASEEEIDAMKEIVRKNMEFGAFGLSSGLVYSPGSVTPTSELIELSKVVSEYDGVYDSHMRNEGAGVIDMGMKELVEIARGANVKAHISHWSVISKNTYDLTPQVIEYIKNARKEGLKISADVTVYYDGCTSLSFLLLSTWVYQNFKENLTKVDMRKKLIREVFEKLHAMFLSDAPFYIKILPNFILKRLLFTGLSKGTMIISCAYNHQVEGKTIFEAIKELYPKKKLEKAFLDFIRDEDGGVMIRYKTKDEEKSMIPIFKQDFVCPSSDGFLVIDKNTHPRSYGTFARVLERWVREKKVVSLEEAVRKMTSLPASILGIRDRGLIKENYKADIVIFDLNNIKEKGTLQNGRQHPEGFDYVIVNGQITAAKGKHLGTLNGQILKHNK